MNALFLLFIKKLIEIHFYFSPVEKLVEGEGGSLYPGQGPHPPYVPCSGSPGGGGAGAWPTSVPGQVPGGHPGYPGLVPGKIYEWSLTNSPSCH